MRVCVRVRACVRVCVCVCACVRVCVRVCVQGGRYAGHGSDAAGELSSRLSDRPDSGDGRHGADAAQGHQELLRGRSRAQTSLSSERTEEWQSTVGNRR